MKLYATTTSERATKGQGGQKFINVSLAGQFRNTAGMTINREVLKVYAEINDNNEILLQVYNTFDNDIKILEKFIPLTLKGKQ